MTMRWESSPDNSDMLDRSGVFVRVRWPAVTACQFIDPVAGPTQTHRRGPGVCVLPEAEPPPPAARLCGARLD